MLTAWAQDEPGPVEFELDARATLVGGEDRAAKYLEYRDIPHVMQLYTLEIGTRPRSDSEHLFHMKFTDAVLDTQSLSMEWVSVGNYTISFNWNRIPHRYGFNATTIYTGIHSGELLLPDATQAALQASANATAAANNLRNFVNAGSMPLDDPDDVMTLRDRFSAGFAWNAAEAWRVTVNVDLEQRSGVRPMWASFGFGNRVEVLIPAEYTTWGFQAAVSYTSHPVDLTLGYTGSLFQNRERDFYWDNPFRNVDSTAANAHASLNTSGPRQGRMALEQNNTMHQCSIRGGYSISRDLRVVADAAWSVRASEFEMLPYTRNVAIVPGAANNPPFDATNPANLPTREFTGQVFTQSYGAAVTARPCSWLDNRLQGRYYIFDDQRQEIDFPGYVRADAVWTNNAANVEPLDYSRWTAGALNTVHLPSIGSRVKPGYEYRQFERQHRQVSKVIEHAWTLSMETDWNGSVQTRIGGAIERRDGSKYRRATAADFLYLRMLDQADRERIKGNAGVTVVLAKEFSAGFGYMVTYDNYDVAFGLRDAAWHGATLDCTVAIDSVSVTAFAGIDMGEFRQKGRQWSQGGLGDPSTPGGAPLAHPNNWELHTVERIFTVGVRPSWEIVPEKLRAAAEATYAWNEAHIDIDSPLGTAGTDSNFYDPIGHPDAENSNRLSVHARVTFYPEPHVNFYIGYQFDSFRSENYYDTGIVPVPVNPAGAYLGSYPLRLNYQDAQIHLAYMGFTIRY
jgi:MtrB/PioB family decaheme-associated outer membrane protein